MRHIGRIAGPEKIVVRRGHVAKLRYTCGFTNQRTRPRGWSLDANEVPDFENQVVTLALEQSSPNVVDLVIETAPEATVKRIDLKLCCDCKPPKKPAQEVTLAVEVYVRE